MSAAPDQQRHDRAALADQRGRGRVRGKRVGEQQQCRTEERTASAAGRPLPASSRQVDAAEAHRRLAPLRTQAVERGQEDDHHQRDLEVRVDEHQTRSGSYSQPAAGEVRAEAVCTHIVSTPLSPTVARNANASVTPPNWASTPQAT